MQTLYLVANGQFFNFFSPKRFVASTVGGTNTSGIWFIGGINPIHVTVAIWSND